METNKLSGNSRAGFIRKVLGILSLQLLVTLAWISQTTFHAPTQNFIKHNVPMMVIVIVFFLISLYALACYPVVGRMVPINFILLFIFTAAEAYMV